MTIDTLPPRLRIHTRERRYLLADAAPVEALLRTRGTPIEYVPGRPESAIHTLYLDTPEGTWSAGRTRTKFRAKRYGDSDTWWFELKRRRGNVVDKWRRPVPAPELPGLLSDPGRWPELAPFLQDRPLRPVAIVRYRRLAWEWDGLRVTIDRDVDFHGVGDGDPLATGPKLGRMRASIVEVKRDGPVVAWLKGPLDAWRVSQFSKSRRALAALRERSWTASA